MKYRRGWIILVVALWCVFTLNRTSHLWACDTVEYITEGSAVVIDGDHHKARQTAVQAAGMAAVDMALADISLDSLLAGFHLSGNTVTLIPFVKIQSGEILHETVSRPKAQGDPQIFSLELKTALCAISTDPEPQFKLSVVLNQPAYIDGDPMQLRLRASHDCQYAVFIVTGDGGVLRLIPSRVKKDNALKAGQTALFPGDADIRRGVHLRAHVAEKGHATTETLFALALRETRFETTDAMDEAIYGLYDGRTASLKDLIRQVAAIPLAHRAEYMVRYVIRPKS